MFHSKHIFLFTRCGNNWYGAEENHLLKTSNIYTRNEAFHVTVTAFLIAAFLACDQFQTIFILIKQTCICMHEGMLSEDRYGKHKKKRGKNINWFENRCLLKQKNAYRYKYNRLLLLENKFGNIYFSKTIQNWVT